MENPNVQARANYEVARKHNKPIIVMEPIKGGKLANPPKAVKEIFKSVNPDYSFASWALRFVASLDGVYSTLSGMSNTEQMLDNLNTMREFKPLSEKEYEAIRQAQKIFGNTTYIDCTKCEYCVKSCPKNIPIPNIFENYNNYLATGQVEQSREAYKKSIRFKGSASDCINCKTCENNCPQHLPITDNLKKARTVFES